MSDIRFNQWLHQSGTGGVSQDHIGNIGIGTTNPSIVVSAANTAVLNVGVITANNLFVNNAFNGDITGNVTGNISGATGTFSGNVDIADKIIHTGDTDTAMRFPADNTFAVDTAGSERFRIDSNGNIGIGVNNPSSFNSDGRNLVVGTGSGGQGISIYSANNSYGTIYFADGTSGSELYRGGLLYNHASDFLRFDTAGAERLRITSAGEVRQQSTGGSTIYELKRSDANTTGSVGTINYTASDGHSVASMSAIGDGDNEGAHLVFRTTSAAANNSPYNAATPERLRITSDGKIGVGVASPSEMMEITNTGGTGTQIQLRDTSTGTGSGDGVRFGYNGSGAQIWNFESTYIRFATSNAERLRITSDGKLGHGTASPSSAFHGTVSSGGYGATFESTANGGESVVTIKGKKSDGTVRSAIFKYDNSDMIRLGTSQSIPMRFETSDTERLRISADGYVTKPNQPRFFATLSATYTGYNGQNTGGTWIAYNNTIYNVGGGFQTSGSDLGLFVAPVSGLYLFHAAAYKGTTTGDWTQSWFNVNSSRANGTDFVHSSGTRFAQNAIQVYMTAGQKIGFHPYNNLTNNEIRSTGNHTWFKGCLLG